MAIGEHSWISQAGQKAEGMHEVEDAREMQLCAERIWNAISKYVAFEQDAVFKDPEWPHLWQKK